MVNDYIAEQRALGVRFPLAPPHERHNQWAGFLFGKIKRADSHLDQIIKIHRPAWFSVIYPLKNIEAVGFSCIIYICGWLLFRKKGGHFLCLPLRPNQKTVWQFFRHPAEIFTGPIQACAHACRLNPKHCGQFISSKSLFLNHNNHLTSGGRD